MRKAASKALYLFLCSILGMILLVMLHRAIFVIYDLLLIIDYNTFSLGISSAVLSWIDFLSMVVAIFLGGWYGTVLGLDWYSIVYGPNAEKPARLFHGFVPHHWRNRKTTKRVTAATSHMQMPVAESQVRVPVKEAREGSFDDLMTPAAEPKKRITARKPAVRKTVRKTAAKRTKIITE